MLKIISRMEREEQEHEKPVYYGKGCLVVYVPRELDHHQANRIRTETDLLIDTYHVRHLVFDLQRQSLWTAPGLG